MYDELAIAIAVSGSSSFVGSPGEPGCKIGTLAFVGSTVRVKKSSVIFIKRFDFDLRVFDLSIMIEFFPLSFKNYLF